ncbi:MAG: hypothetical protein K0Q79_425 [Flavipsychrobacter sp.]|jgi:hypothetical protein|nr:hypothetical protein [Flavipsychrobacter sp.]
MSTQKPTKAGPTKLPSKQIVFSNQPGKKKGGNVKANVNSSKKGGVNHMRKLSGM